VECSTPGAVTINSSGGKVGCGVRSRSPDRRAINACHSLRCVVKWPQNATCSSAPLAAETRTMHPRGGGGMERCQVTVPDWVPAAGAACRLRFLSPSAERRDGAKCGHAPVQGLLCGRGLRASTLAPPLVRHQGSVHPRGCPPSRPQRSLPGTLVARPLADERRQKSRAEFSTLGAVPVRDSGNQSSVLRDARPCHCGGRCASQFDFIRTGVSVEERNCRDVPDCSGARGPRPRTQAAEEDRDVRLCGCWSI
jgi:hypothetical protein